MSTTHTADSQAVAGQVERTVRQRPVEYGSDEHLTLLGSAWHLNLLTGVDLADVLAFGRACMAAERERQCAAIKAADDKASEGDYMLDSDDCISVIRGTWRLGA